MNDTQEGRADEVLSKRDERGKSVLLGVLNIFILVQEHQLEEAECWKAVLKGLGVTYDEIKAASLDAVYVLFGDDGMNEASLLMRITE